MFCFLFLPNNDKHDMLSKKNSRFLFYRYKTFFRLKWTDYAAC